MKTKESLHSRRYTALPMPALVTPVFDTLARPLRDLRISVTDRCNFRCPYCMPKAVFGRDYPFLPRSEVLSFEEITRLAQVFVSLGVEKIRLTGGEPLLRKDLEKLIALLAPLTTPKGQVLDLALTTNGVLLAQKAHALAAAGLKRLTVSLDAIDDALFQRMNDAQIQVKQVLEGIDAAVNAGFSALKINVVVQRGVNDTQIEKIARHFKGSGHTVRFIEFMDVGNTNAWNSVQVIPSAEVIERLQHFSPLAPVSDAPYAGVAQRWRYLDGSGEVGVISSVTQAFCSDCTRARLSTDGQLFLCLFAGKGKDLRRLIRSEALSDAELKQTIAGFWQQRRDRYSQLRQPGVAPGWQKVEMSFIGG